MRRIASGGSACTRVGASVLASGAGAGAVRSGSCGRRRGRIACRRGRAACPVRIDRRGACIVGWGSASGRESAKVASRSSSNSIAGRRRGSMVVISRWAVGRGG
jgi:hypothetical protein